MFFVLFLIAFNHQIKADVENLRVWVPFSEVDKAEYFFIAFQEPQFVRARSGEWLPKSLFQNSGQTEIFYSIDEIRKEGLKMSISIFLRNRDSEDVKSISWQWTLPSEVSKVDVISEKPGVIAVCYPKTGEVRKIILTSDDSLLDLKKRFSISRSAPMWRWSAVSWK